MAAALRGLLGKNGRAKGGKFRAHFGAKEPASSALRREHAIVALAARVSGDFGARRAQRD